MGTYIILARDNDGTPLVGKSPEFYLFTNTVGSGITPPTIVSIGSGIYTFDYSPSSDIVFIIDTDIPPSGLDDDRRYIPGTIGPSDEYLDDTISSRDTPDDVNINIATD